MEGFEAPDDFEQPTFEFDGHTFEKTPGNYARLVVLDLAYRARRGDEAAAALLNGNGDAIRDANGRWYWPKEA